MPKIIGKSKYKLTEHNDETDMLLTTHAIERTHFLK